MCSSVVLVGLCWGAKSRSTSNAEILTDLIVLLWVQMGFSKDVSSTFSSPVPFDHLSSKIGDVAEMQNIVVLFKSGSLGWTGM